MSEEILKALMQLFAIIAKQDEGVGDVQIDFVKSFLTQQLSEDTVKEYLNLFYKHADLIQDEEKKDKEEEAGEEKKKKRKLTSVKDSVRILGICKKINKTLTQNQKAVVLVRLFELINADQKFTEQRMAIINTVAEVFKIEHEEFISIENFVIKDDTKDLDDVNLLIINDKIGEDCKNCKKINTESLDGNIFILCIQSVDLYFMKYTGNEDINMNGLPVHNRRIYLFASGSSIKPPKGLPVYYSDVVSHFLQDTTSIRISYNVRNVEYQFKSGDTGLRNINLSEQQGRLVGIMGASGAGKTTLLNVLSGIDKPTSGEVLINGIDLYEENKKLKGVIGYIPQDDLLIEELTVFDNLYYNAKLCFKDKSDAEIVELVEKTLQNLGLYERKDLKVGSPLNKMISGGQRKRLNIALELIREPSILFVDEPTSGLSSRDSDNIMDLLRELTLKGKLVFVVIHQPSSDIYKMFDKMIILDTGGYLVFYDNPVEAVMYFKRIDQQINSDVGECPTCGNVNPELIFNILEAKVVDDFGNYTETRKVTPQKWEAFYQDNFKTEPAEHIQEEPPSSLNIPSWFTQFKIYSLRDFFSKISNRQYIMLNLLEAPILGFILSYLIRYIADPNSNTYIFRENENIPIYIFMCLIVALFLGLIVSAEEIFRDRKILKRESFLNLSRSSYLMSKVLILVVISAIQAILFVLVGNSILGIKSMTFEYWFTLFTIATFANLLGLNISAAFNSAVTIYILIPLLMIPQMILGGAMFTFDKLNRTIGSIDKVPVIAEFMATKWAYEALMVHHFKDNKFEKMLYDIEKHESVADFKVVYYIPELIEVVNENLANIKETGDSITAVKKENFALLRNEIGKEMKKVEQIPFPVFNMLHIDSFTNIVAFETKDYLKKLNNYYSSVFQQYNNKKENLINFLVESGQYQKRDQYYNESVADIVKKVFEKNKILRYKDQLIQQVDPIYQDPEASCYLCFRSHFFAPRKYFMGQFFDTFWFNTLFIWFMTVVLYICLYFDLFRKLVNLFGKN